MKPPLFIFTFLFFISYNCCSCYSNGCYGSREELESREIRTWPEGKVHFQFDNDYFTAPQDRNNFAQAAQYIEERTCVKFIQFNGTDDEDADVFVGSGEDGHRATRPQPICFAADEKLDVYKRQLVHVLGLPSEYRRQDWNDFVDYKNSDCHHRHGGWRRESGIPKEATDTMFDYTSFLMTEAECFKPLKDVVPEDIPFGPGPNPSVVDVERLNAIYDCGDCYGYRFKLISHENTPLPIGKESDDQDLFACRVYHEGHRLIGNYRPHNNGAKCLASFDGAAKEYSKMFEVLENPNPDKFNWVEGGHDTPLPDNAVRRGRTKDRETIYMARCNITEGGHTLSIPGYVLESNVEEARIATKEGTKRCTDFEYYVCDGGEKYNPYGG